MDLQQARLWYVVAAQQGRPEAEEKLRGLGR
jgi:TPR repeat protein